ncbi:glutaminase A [Bhargavaea beijingensis]|uniref:Glutaminase n=1 Tax=Bhargavaea beijingensis TaxID=426756 RepID=A0A1G6XK05_9BACL|nr:glutaminase A [Bhargavaea beijingensis]MCW1928083.1 glutaminase A [Bhargavaea beijingensis]SDD77526.1 L-glutaminase [Bhargavaea beijingensis]
MDCRSDEELYQLVQESKVHTIEGKVADYIPALAKADLSSLSVAMAFPDGSCYSAGDIETKSTLQSISKVIALALALLDNGEEYVFQRVGMEPTGDPFNSIIKLETIAPHKPLNPMINAGAIAVSSMIKGDSIEERLGRLIQLTELIIGEEGIGYNEEVAQSELETADLNRSMAYYLKQHSVIEEEVETVIELYTKQCAIELNCIGLAKVGLLLAMDGKHPDTGEMILPPRVASICKTFMVTCGMYNASGEFAIRVGVPAKSGVSGGIMASVPQRCGIGIFGPALDDRGNSVAGWDLMEKMSKKYDLSMF